VWGGSGRSRRVGQGSFGGRRPTSGRCDGRTGAPALATLAGPTLPNSPRSDFFSTPRCLVESYSASRRRRRISEVPNTYGFTSLKPRRFATNNFPKMAITGVSGKLFAACLASTTTARSADDVVRPSCQRASTPARTKSARAVGLYHAILNNCPLTLSLVSRAAAQLARAAAVATILQKIAAPRAFFQSPTGDWHPQMELADFRARAIAPRTGSWTSDIVPGARPR